MFKNVYLKCQIYLIIVLYNFIFSDLERVREGTGYKFALIIQYFSTFIAGISVGLYVNTQLTLVILCIGPFLIALNSYLAKV